MRRLAAEKVRENYVKVLRRRTEEEKVVVQIMIDAMNIGAIGDMYYKHNVYGIREIKIE
ncbi:unnamed protein product [Sphenostylis stenocarpa]|uniref:Uncharacterized protein n=1 Tax=Sphenostylis stenocarpa TaxID=92480 RepID=A0AA86SYT0_9FABA|nr:unnamed protein product [Sphenostylis stenocarpa]